MKRLALFSVVLFFGCTSIKDENPETPELTYYEDVRPMLDTYCSRCHVDDGTAPIDFRDPDNAIAFADVMLAQIDAGLMPPPVSDPTCRDYVDSERMHLPEDAREMLAEWIALGKPLGNESDIVTVDAVATELENPDLTITIPTPYSPKFEDEANPGNEYRCFYLEHDRDEDFFITGMAPAVDQKSLSHHIVIAKAPKNSVQEKHKTDEGWSCINGEGTSVLDGMIAGWAPGTVPFTFEEGMGLKMGKDEAFILQMHYFANDAEAVEEGDQSGYQFTTTESVDREILMYPLGTQNFKIPAGAKEHTESMSFTIPNGISARAHGTFPHMHILGSGYRLWLEHGDGTETCAADSKGWDFDNQITYMYKESLLLQGGDTIHFECTWDNSDTNPDRIHDVPQDTYYGERTDEEMCFAFTFLSLGG